MSERRLEYVDLEDLRENPRNAKAHALAELDASFSRFGYVEPVVVDERTGLLASGHGRREQLLARRAQGESPPPGVLVEDGRWLVPVVRGWASENDDEASAFLVAANRLTELGGWQEDRLGDLLDELHKGPGLLGTGFSGPDVKSLLDRLRPKTFHTDPDAVPEPPEEPVTKAGDLWLLGDHRLLCGDATKAEDVTVLFDGGHADMLWTDPPYGVDYHATNLSRSGSDIIGDGRDAEVLRVLLARTFERALTASRPGAVWFVAAPANPPLAVFAQELLRLGIYRQLLVWVKNRPILSRSDYHYQHENLFYGWTPGAAHQPPPTHSTSSLWHFDSPSASKLHPTQKPVGLVVQALRDHSLSDEVVYDPFLGSGTTLIAAEQVGRRSYSMEISPTYCDVAARRWEQFTGRTAELVRSSEMPESPLESVASAVDTVKTEP